MAIAKNFENCKVTATDISDDALKMAAVNISNHGLENKIDLMTGDLFQPLIEGLDQTKFDLIVTNPPYVSESEYEKLEKNVKDHEPRSALYGGTDGLDIYRRIVDGVMDHLKPEGALIMEIGFSQGPQIKQLLEPLFTNIKIEKDLSDNDRIVIASNQQIKGYVPLQPEDQPLKDLALKNPQSDSEKLQ